MTSQRPEKSPQSGSGSAVVSEPKSTGMFKPNLIAHYDRGTQGYPDTRKHLFLLQCEVAINAPDQFEKVHSGLEGKNFEGKKVEMAEVQQIVTSNIADGATPIFKEIIERGFKDNSAPLFGTFKPNLIAHYDRGNLQHLFLLQCEVAINDPDQFEKVHSGLEGKSVAGIAEVKQIVTSNIPGGASPIFREIIERGFQDNSAP